MKKKLTTNLIKTTALFVILITIIFVANGSAQKKRSSVGKTQKTATGIRKVDFKNFNYSSSGDWCRGKLVLRKGHAKYGDSNYDTADLSSVRYVDFDGDGKEEAFVVIEWSTFGTAGGGVDVFVFSYRNDSAIKIWSKCNERSGAKLVGRSILFTYPEYIGDDAHCCPTYITTETYTWKRNGFVRTSKKRKRSGYK